MKIENIKFKDKCLTLKYADKIVCGSLVSFPDGSIFGMKEEGHCKYWHRGSIVRWWTRERRKQKKYVRKHPECVIWI